MRLSLYCLPDEILLLSFSFLDHPLHLLHLETCCRRFQTLLQCCAEEQTDNDSNEWRAILKILQNRFKPANLLWRRMYSHYFQNRRLGNNRSSRVAAIREGNENGQDYQSSQDADAVSDDDLDSVMHVVNEQPSNLDLDASISEMELLLLNSGSWKHALLKRRKIESHGIFSTYIPFHIVESEAHHYQIVHYYVLDSFARTVLFNLDGQGIAFPSFELVICFDPIALTFQWVHLVLRNIPKPLFDKLRQYVRNNVVREEHFDQFDHFITVGEVVLGLTEHDAIRSFIDPCLPVESMKEFLELRDDIGGSVILDFFYYSVVSVNFEPQQVHSNALLKDSPSRLALRHMRKCWFQCATCQEVYICSSCINHCQCVLHGHHISWRNHLPNFNCTICGEPCCNSLYSSYTPPQSNEECDTNISAAPHEIQKLGFLLQRSIANNDMPILRGHYFFQKLDASHQMGMGLQITGCEIRHHPHSPESTYCYIRGVLLWENDNRADHEQLCWEFEGSIFIEVIAHCKMISLTAHKSSPSIMNASHISRECCAFIGSIHGQTVNGRVQFVDGSTGGFEVEMSSCSMTSAKFVQLDLQHFIRLAESRQEPTQIAGLDGIRELLPGNEFTVFASPAICRLLTSVLKSANIELKVRCSTLWCTGLSNPKVACLIVYRHPEVVNVIIKSVIRMKQPKKPQLPWSRQIVINLCRSLSYLYHGFIESNPPCASRCQRVRISNTLLEVLQRQAADGVPDFEILFGVVSSLESIVLTCIEDSSLEGHIIINDSIVLICMDIMSKMMATIMKYARYHCRQGHLNTSDDVDRIHVMEEIEGEQSPCSNNSTLCAKSIASMSVVLSFLSLLTSRPSNARKILISQGGLDMLLSAITILEQHESVMASALATLGNILCGCSPEVWTHLCRAGLVDRLLRYSASPFSTFAPYFIWISASMDSDEPLDYMVQNGVHHVLSSISHSVLDAIRHADALDTLQEDSAHKAMEICLAITMVAYQVEVRLCRWEKCPSERNRALYQSVYGFLTGNMPSAQKEDSGGQCSSTLPWTALYSELQRLIRQSRSAAAAAAAPWWKDTFLERHLCTSLSKNDTIRNFLEWIQHTD